MSIKIVLLRSGEQIISDVHEICTEEDKAVAYSLTRPCVFAMEQINSEDSIKTNDPTPFNVSLYPWVPLSTNDKIVIPYDHPVAFVDPINQLLEMYQTQILDILKEEKND